MKKLIAAALAVTAALSLSACAERGSWESFEACLEWAGGYAAAENYEWYVDAVRKYRQTGELPISGVNAIVACAKVMPR